MSKKSKWSLSSEKQRDLMKLLAPQGVPRQLFRHLFELSPAQIASRATVTGLLFEKYEPADEPTIRHLLKEANVPEEEIDRALNVYTEALKKRSGKGETRARRTPGTPAPTRANRVVKIDVKRSIEPPTPIQWPTEGEIAAEFGRQIRAAADKER